MDSSDKLDQLQQRAAEAKQAAQAAWGVRKGVHAARRYWCRRPPSRSRRCTMPD
jgi:hypothetical protein